MGERSLRESSVRVPCAVGEYLSTSLAHHPTRHRLPAVRLEGVGNSRNFHILPSYRINDTWSFHIGRHRCCQPVRVHFPGPVASFTTSPNACGADSDSNNVVSVAVFGTEASVRRPRVCVLWTTCLSSFLFLVWRGGGGGGGNPRVWAHSWRLGFVRGCTVSHNCCWLPSAMCELASW